LAKNSQTKDYRGGIPGALYFATDSRRMFMGLEDKTIVPINDSIIIVAKVSDLPYSIPVYDPENEDSTIGTFYYAIAENVMCVYRYDPVEKKYAWCQINPDTKTTDLDISATVSGDATSGYSATIAYNLANNRD
jgi:hypothetical protein